MDNHDLNFDQNPFDRQQPARPSFDMTWVFGIVGLLGVCMVCACVSGIPVVMVLRDNWALWGGNAIEVEVPGIDFASIDDYSTVAQRRIEIGDVLTSRLYSTESADNWVFEGTAGQTVMVQINALGSADPVVALYDSQGYQLAWDDDSGGGLNSLITASLPTDGIYIVRVNTYSPGDYEIHLDELELEAVIEIEIPGVDFSAIDGHPTLEQRPLAFGQVDGSQLISTNVAHNWVFEGTAGQTVSIQVDSLGNIDPIAALFDTQGNQLAWNDDSGGGLNSLIIAPLPADGTYVVRVTGYSPGDYEIYLDEIELETVIEVEVPGIDFTVFDGYPTVEQRRLAFGQTEDSRLANASVAHNWVFEGIAGQTVSIRVNDLGGIDPMVTLFDSQGGQLAWDDDGGGGLNSLIIAILPADGTYIARVTGRAAGDYQIHLGEMEVVIEVEVPGVDFAALDGYATVEQRRIEFGQNDSSRLLSANVAHNWVFTGTAGQTVTIHVNARNGFDPYISLLDAQGSELAWDDDSGGNLNALIETTLPADGMYIIRVRGYTAGAYDITIRLN